MSSKKKTDTPGFPKSKDGLQCIGPCYPPDSMVMHPITLKYITAGNNLPFCPIDLIRTAEGTKKTIAECDLDPTQTIKEAEESYLYPSLSFDSEIFLRYFYGLNSLEAVFAYAEEHFSLPRPTLYRLFDSAWKAFGSEPSVLTDPVISFCQIFIRKFWLPYFRVALGPRLKISEGKVKVLSSPSKDFLRTPAEIDAYLDKKLTDSNFLLSVLSKIQTKHSPSWKAYSSLHTVFRLEIEEAAKRKILKI